MIVGISDAEPALPMLVRVISAAAALEPCHVRKFDPGQWISRWVPLW